MGTERCEDLLNIVIKIIIYYENNVVIVWKRVCLKVKVWQMC